MKKILIVALVLTVLGCKQESYESPVLVTVNGSVITQAELDQTLQRTLRIQNPDQVDEKLRKNILDTMVLSRVVTQAAEKQLDQAKQDELQMKIQMFREDLFLKAYLQKFSPPRPPTMQMIREYYTNNPEKFGGRSIHDYEMLAGVNKNDESKRVEIMQMFAKANKAADWRQYASQLLKQGVQVRYSQGQARDPILHERLRTTIKSMQKGDVSPVVLVDGAPFVLRIKAIRTVDPQPLEHVSADIRRSLLPIQLKKSLEKISSELMSQANIQYGSME